MCEYCASIIYNTKKCPPLFMPIFNVTDQNISQAAQIIIKGGLVGMPTETVYGLAANCLDSDACVKIFETKRRPANDPLIVHISDVEQLETIVTIQTYQRQILNIIIDKFWPGPLTVILQKHQVIPPICTAGGDTVGVRFPRHPVAQKLISAAGVPLAAPSANLFGHISPVTAQHVQHDFPDLFILDGDNCEIGLESTVLQIKENNEIFIYRRGGITEEMIKNALESENIAFKITAKHISSSSIEKAQISPGTNITHYAPNNCRSVFLIQNINVLQEFFKQNIDTTVQNILDQNKVEICDLINQNIDQDISIINCSKTFNIDVLNQLTKSKFNIYDIRMTPHQKFFYTLHQVEANHSNILFVIPPIYDGNYDSFGASLFDRIYRCCSGKYAIFPQKLEQ